MPRQWQIILNGQGDTPITADELEAVARAAAVDRLKDGFAQGSITWGEGTYSRAAAFGRGDVDGSAPDALSRLSAGDRDSALARQATPDPDPA